VSDQELERMVVTLDGDMQGYKAMAEEAKHETSALGRSFESHGMAVERLSSKVEGFGHSVVGALEALGAEHFLKESLGEWQEAEEGMHHLEAALKSNGREVEKTKDDYAEFASNIQRTTTMSDDAMIHLLSMAETFELTGDHAKKAAVNAQAIAAVTGGSASQYLRFTAALEKGDSAMAMRMARMIPQLRGVKDGQQFAAKTAQLLKTGMEMVHKEADSSSGSLKQLTNLWGDFKEGLGQVVAEGLKPFVGYAKEASVLLGDLSPETKRLLVQVLAAGAGIIMLGPVISMLGVAFGPVVGAVGTLLPMLGLLVNPITLAVGAAALLSTYFVDWKSVGGDAIAWLTRQWDGLVEHFSPAFEGIKDALAAGDLELAFKVVVAQLKYDWATFNASFVEYWNATKDVFVDGWYDMNFELEQSSFDLIGYLKRDWTEYFDWFAEHFAMLLDAAGDKEGADAFRKLAAYSVAEVERGVKLAKDANKQKHAEEDRARKESRAKDLEDAKQGAKDAKKALDDAIDDSIWAAFWADFDKEEGDALGDLDIKPPPGKEPKISAKVEPKWDAAAFTSVEARARMHDFADTIRMQIEDNPTGKKEKDPNTPILEDIRDELKDRSDVGVTDLG
jgi:hypothetical protein